MLELKRYYMEGVYDGDQSRLRRRLSREAISLALRGDWERAVEVNQALLDELGNDVDAMNRLGKALIELGRYGEARGVLDRVATLAPYNAITKKNLTRLARLERSPAPRKPVRKGGRTPQLFIEESGKSSTTVLPKPSSDQVVARIGSGDPVNLVVEKNAVSVYSREEEYLGRVEPKLGRRLLRLVGGGNRYDAAVIGVNDRGISLIIRETYRHPSLHDVCSFPTRSKEEHRVYLGDSLLRYLEDNEVEGREEEDGLMAEAELESEWSE